MSIANVSPSKRGMLSQSIVAEAVKRYNRLGRACIQEIEVPKTIAKNGSFYREKSTVDFVGIGYNRPVAFDVKSTRCRTRFDLNLVKEHQFEYLSRFHEQGGIGFVLLHMIKHNEWYVIPFKVLEQYMEMAQNGGRQSIPYEEMRIGLPMITEGGKTGLDFLEKIIWRR